MVRAGGEGPRARAWAWADHLASGTERYIAGLAGAERKRTRPVEKNFVEWGCAPTRAGGEAAW